MDEHGEKKPLIEKSVDRCSFGSCNKPDRVLQHTTNEQGSYCEESENTPLLATTTSWSPKVSTLRNRSLVHSWDVEDSNAHVQITNTRRNVVESRRWGDCCVLGYERVQKTGSADRDSTQQSPRLIERMINFIAWVVIIVIPIFWMFMFRTVKEFERALIFRLGRVQDKVRGPGLFWLNPLLDKVVVVDLRIEAIILESQYMVTKDSVTVRVDGLVYLKVTDPKKAVLEVENYKLASQMFAAASLRSVVGSVTLETTLTNRERVNVLLKEVVERECKKWGLAILAIEIRDLNLSREMQRPMAAEAESERYRRARKISSLGEVEAATNLAKAGSMICSSTPGGMTLRFLFTFTNIAHLRETTIIYPLVINLFTSFKRQSRRSKLRPAGNENENYIEGCL